MKIELEIPEGYRLDGLTETITRKLAVQWTCYVRLRRLGSTAFGYGIGDTAQQAIDNGILQLGARVREEARSQSALGDIVLDLSSLEK